MRDSSAPAQGRVGGASHLRKPSIGSSSTAILVFLIPALQFIRIKITGVLSGSDILLMAAFIVLALRGKIGVSVRIGRKFLILCSLWLLSQIVTDFVRHTPFGDYVRGWSNIGMTLVSFSVMFSLLYGHPRRIVLYAWGLVAGSALAYFINPSELALIDPWKFGLSYPITLTALLLASRNDVRGHWPMAVTTFAGFLNFVLGFRNAGGICLAVALYLMVIRYSHKKGFGNRKLSAKTITALAASIILGLIGIYCAYQYAASTGLMGDDAREKYETQSSGKYGAFLGGRFELLSSIPAIIDSPILGHGSWAKDPKYVLLEQQALALLGYRDAGDLSIDDLKEGLIPSHSFILGAWVDAGILGAIFWGWVWLLVCKTLLRTYPRGIKLLPLAAYAAFQLLWDIPFSPYGAQMRIISPFYIVIIMNYLSIARNPAQVAPSSATTGLKIA